MIASNNVFFTEYEEDITNSPTLTLEGSTVVSNNVFFTEYEEDIANSPTFTIEGTSIKNNNVPVVIAQPFTTAGTYTWTVPDGVTSISAVAVGGGGGGGGAGGYGQNAAGGRGGGGGALSYLNNISVTSGEVLTIISGSAGTAGAYTGQVTAKDGAAGVDSQIRRANNSVIFFAKAAVMVAVLQPSTN